MDISLSRGKYVAFTKNVMSLKEPYCRLWKSLDPTPEI